MKKLFIACLITFVAASAINAQDTTSTDRSQDQYRTQDMNQDQDQEMYKEKGKEEQWDDKDMISVSELPQNIREQLQSQDYRSWNVSKAYRKMKDGEIFYAVELVNGNQKQKVKFDADGNVVKKKDHKKEDQY